MHYTLAHVAKAGTHDVAYKSGLPVVECLLCHRAMRPHDATAPNTGNVWFICRGMSHGRRCGFEHRAPFEMWKAATFDAIFAGRRRVRAGVDF
jgi:hypothetical protein